jgi:outer membrane autotransporter protein
MEYWVDLPRSSARWCGGSWGELNTGVSAEITRNASIFANASYQVGLDGRSDA